MLIIFVPISILNIRITISLNKNIKNMNNDDVTSAETANPNTTFGGNIVVPEPTSITGSGTVIEPDHNNQVNKHYNSKKRWMAWAFAAAIGVILLFALVGYVVAQANRSRIAQQKAAQLAEQQKVADEYNITVLPLKDLIKDGQVAIDKQGYLQVNGQLKVANSIVLSPTQQPQNAVAGQFYYDAQKQQPVYYDGTNYMPIASTSNVVSSLQGQSGAVTLSAGAGITITGTTITNSGVTGISGGANQISVTNVGGLYRLALPQDIAVSSNPSFAGLILASALTVANGGTGATSALLARANLGAAASGSNADITALTNINNISSRTGLVVGSTTQSLLLQGGAATALESNNGALKTSLVFASPSANRTITLPDESGTVCLQNSTSCGFGASSSISVLLAPATAQTDANTNSSIFINKTGASGNLLQLQKGGADVFTIDNTGAVTVRNTTNSTTAFQIQDSIGSAGLSYDTNNLTLNLTHHQYGQVGSDIFGADNNTCTGTNWADTGVNTWTHTSGSAGSLTCTSPSIVANSTYEIVYTTTGTSSLHSFRPRMGGKVGNYIYGDVANHTQVITTATTGSFGIVTSLYQTGSISIVSIKQVTTENSVLSVGTDYSSIKALEVRASGNENIGLGYQSLQATYGSQNTGVGSSSLASNLYGSQNTALGTGSLQSNVSGVDNTASGTLSLNQNITGYENVATGSMSLRLNVSGSGNTATGVYSLYSNNGSGNTATGLESLEANTTGNDNAALGSYSMMSNETGNNNTANGAYSLQSNSTGNNNTALGYSAGSANSEYAFNTLQNLQNATMIGSFSQAYANNVVALGGQGVDATKVGIGTGLPLNQFSAEVSRYTTGTVTANTTTVVTGLGTAWLTNASKGDVIYI